MKKLITGVIILVFFTAVCCGVDKAREFLSNFLVGIVNFFKELLPTLEPLISNMGIKEAVIVFVLIGLVTGFSVLFGYKLTKKDKRKTKRVIKDGVEIASKVSEITSAKSGKRK